jgi:transposase
MWQIQVLKKLGFSLRKIAAEVGCAVNTVRVHLARGAAPEYDRKVRRQLSSSRTKSNCARGRLRPAPERIAATVLLREIAARGFAGGLSQLRAFLRTLRPAPPAESLIYFETAMGEQLQVDWVEFRKGEQPLHAFGATVGYSRATYVEFVSDRKVESLIGCHERAFAALGGVPRSVLYDRDFGAQCVRRKVSTATTRASSTSPSTAAS